MGEITIDWVDIPPTSEIFQTKDGKPLVHSRASSIVRYILMQLGSSKLISTSMRRKISSLGLVCLLMKLV